MCILAIDAVQRQRSQQVDLPENANCMDMRRTSFERRDGQRRAMFLSDQNKAIGMPICLTTICIPRLHLLGGCVPDRTTSRRTRVFATDRTALNIFYRVVSAIEPSVVGLRGRRRLRGPSHVRSASVRHRLTNEGHQCSPIKRYFSWVQTLMAYALHLLVAPRQRNINAKQVQWKISATISGQRTLCSFQRMND
jgi:hypothetical protein